MSSKKTTLEDLEALMLTLLFKIDSLRKRRRKGSRISEELTSLDVNGDVISIVKAAIREVYKISLEELNKKGRSKHIIDPRTTGMALSWEFRGGTMQKIAESFGCADHGSVIGARGRVIDMCEVDHKFRKKYDACKANVREKLFMSEPEYQI